MRRWTGSWNSRRRPFATLGCGAIPSRRAAGGWRLAAKVHDLPSVSYLPDAVARLETVGIASIWSEYCACRLIPSTRTTQLYDRRSDQVSLDEIERVRI
jgi:hypothetical protein